eukprot:scaffold8887_cov73-Skeletonema_marinoi.AAC.1
MFDRGLCPLPRLRTNSVTPNLPHITLMRGNTFGSGSAHKKQATNTTTTTTHIMADSIVDFPHKRNYDHGRSVRFAAMNTSQCNVKHYDHEGCLARHELWYTKAEYEAMRLAVKEDVLEVRSKVAH